MSFPNQWPLPKLHVRVVIFRSKLCGQPTTGAKLTLMTKDHQPKQSEMPQKAVLYNI